LNFNFKPRYIPNSVQFYYFAYMQGLSFDPVFEEICFPALREYLLDLQNEAEQITDRRKKELQQIADFVAGKLQSDESAKLVFICTHNSRRSHFGQVWASVAASAFGLAGLETYSGGTAVTAFNSRAASALERAGYRVHRPAGSNPAYEVTWSGRRPAMICFSKIYDDNANPRRGFGAVMTCSEADRACPLIPGAAERFALPYTDPKTADGTPVEAARYDERCRDIGREMLYLFGKVKGGLIFNA
jgi:hypothetical protein